MSGRLQHVREATSTGRPSLPCSLRLLCRCLPALTSLRARLCRSPRAPCTFLCITPHDVSNGTTKWQKGPAVLENSQKLSARPAQSVAAEWVRWKADATAPVPLGLGTGRMSPTGRAACIHAQPIQHTRDRASKVPSDVSRRDQPYDEKRSHDMDKWWCIFGGGFQPSCYKARLRRTLREMSVGSVIMSQTLSMSWSI